MKIIMKHAEWFSTQFFKHVYPRVEQSNCSSDAFGRIHLFKNHYYNIIESLDQCQ